MSLLIKCFFSYPDCLDVNNFTEQMFLRVCFSFSYPDCLAANSFTDQEFLNEFCQGPRGADSRFSLTDQCRLNFPDSPSSQPCFNNVSCFYIVTPQILECSYFIEFIKHVEEKDEMLGKPRILSLFHNEFNKFNNKRARM